MIWHIHVHMVCFSWSFGWEHGHFGLMIWRLTHLSLSHMEKIVYRGIDLVIDDYPLLHGALLR